MVPRGVLSPRRSLGLKAFTGEAFQPCSAPATSRGTMDDIGPGCGLGLSPHGSLWDPVRELSRGTGQIRILPPSQEDMDVELVYDAELLGDDEQEVDIGDLVDAVLLPADDRPGRSGSLRTSKNF